MGEDGEASHYLDLSREFIAGARVAAEADHLAPARFNSIHALELGLKAAIIARLGNAPRIHNIGGEFGRLFRPRLGTDILRKINRLLDDYNSPRYPDWETPEAATVLADIEFIERLLAEDIPALIREVVG